MFKVTSVIPVFAADVAASYCLGEERGRPNCTASTHEREVIGMCINYDRDCIMRGFLTNENGM